MRRTRRVRRRIALGSITRSNTHKGRVGRKLLPTRVLTLLKQKSFLYFLLFAPGWLLATPTPTPAPSEARPDSAGTETAAAPDSAELTKLLRDFLAGASRNDVAMHDRFWAEDLIYTSSEGRRIGKADIMRDVRAEGPPKPEDGVTIFSAEDIRIHQYDSTAIVACRLVGTTRKGDKTDVANYLNTGTLLKRNGKWQAVSWQATKIPAG